MNIGVDIGGSTIGISMVARDESQICYKVIATPLSRNLDEVEDCILREIESLLRGLDTDVNSIDSIGVGVPGIVSPDGYRIINCPNLSWYNTSFGEKLFKWIGVRPTLFNDASAAGFGEYIYGNLKGVHRGVILTLGTGLGGGIVLDGHIYSGHSGLASEFGHMTVGANYYDCSCGRNGCLETFVSATSLLAHANRLLEFRGSDSRLSSAKEIFERYRIGDSIAVETVNRFLKYMAIGINNIVLTIDPELIVIGGGISLSGELFMDKLRSLVLETRAFKAVSPPRLVTSAVDERAGALGAALLGKKYASL